MVWIETRTIERMMWVGIISETKTIFNINTWTVMLETQGDAPSDIYLFIY